MTELFSGSQQYSSGWKPIVREDENSASNMEIDKRLKALVAEFDKLKTELDEKIHLVIEQSYKTENDLKRDIEDLNSVLDLKDQEIKRLTEENITLKTKYEIVNEQLVNIISKRNKGFFEFIFKKITDGKSHQNEKVHSID